MRHSKSFTGKYHRKIRPWSVRFLCLAMLSTVATTVGAQESSLSSSDPASLTAPTTENPSGLQQGRGGLAIPLPSDRGQYWEEYDIRTYTQHLTGEPRPEQALIDWILRETGTDAWFGEPFGVLQANKNVLRVYHTPAMHQVVKKIYERFVNGTIEPQVFGMRIVTISNPNWRTRAVAWMKSVQVQSPGVQGWLMSKENNAMLLAMLRGRNDFREVQAVDMVLFNGQSQTLEQGRVRAYLKEYQKSDQGWPPYLPVNAELKEGYRMHFSPLLDIENRTVDVVLNCSIDQIEQLNNISIELPLATGQIQVAPIAVPQLSSWRLHERFQWPTDQVLVLSCGVIAAPGNEAPSLLGSGGGKPLSRLLSPSTGDRADALLFIEYKGNATTHLPTQSATSPALPQTATNPISRGRY